MAFAILFILLVGCAMAEHSAHLTGVFGHQDFPLDVMFGEDLIKVPISRPFNAPDNCRETTNIHIFSKNFQLEILEWTINPDHSRGGIVHLVVQRSSKEKECYVRRSIASFDFVKGRVDNAEYNKGMMGEMREEVLHLHGIPPISPRTVRLLLGPRVVEFCRGHEVYLIGPEDYATLSPRELILKNHGAAIVVSLDSVEDQDRTELFYLFGAFDK